MSITARIDNVVHVREPWLREDPPAPIALKIELNSRCAYRCSFCVRSIRDNDKIDLDRALFSRIMREAHAYGVREAGLFFINEPFSVPWLGEAIRECKAIGYDYVFLTTNGAVATPQRVELAMAAGLDSLKFSLNFADAEQLASIAGVSPTVFERVKVNLQAARALRDDKGYATRLYASSIAFDGEQGERMRDLVAAIRPFVDEHYWLPLYGMSGAAKEAGWQPRAGNPGRLDHMRRDPLPCWSVFTEAHVTADGVLSACCFGNGLDGDLAMADLKRMSFGEGWHSEAFKMLRRAHLRQDVAQTACRDCAAA